MSGVKIFVINNVNAVPAGDAPAPQIKNANIPAMIPHTAFPYFVLGAEDDSVKTKNAANNIPLVKSAANMSPEK